jgi:hypothetical protein
MVNLTHVSAVRLLTIILVSWLADSPATYREQIPRPSATPFSRGNCTVPPLKGGAEERGGGFFIQKDRIRMI